ncbi:EAL and HDOD domain-containing protein [Vibrio sp.]|uniref:EAL and HDOD domain-containing protein n=1 Tax=Vibrio sp. TaxID=678 RepID=UPI003D11B459
MTHTYVARQPIFNAKRQTLGYELLFRDGEHNGFPAHIESNRATYRLIVENFLSIGTNPALEASRCFINFPYQSLLRRLPFSLPKEKIVVEILENCPADDKLFAVVEELNQQGYLIALDDFVYSPQWERFLPLVHIVKLDIMTLGLEQACQLVKRWRSQGSKKKFLAEKVETEAQFQAARSAGFQFFQGYFFSHPELIKQRYISPEQMIAMELFREVSLPEVNFARVEQIVAKDVALSYKLLRFVNTMSSRLEVTISSFRQALVYLGEDKLRLFVALAVASYVSAKKPKELYHLALQRAQFCWLMSGQLPSTQYQDQAFLIGLFSIMDALLDSSLDYLVEQLPLTQAIKLALLERHGPYGALLNVEECFEQADWQGLQRGCQELDLELDEVFDNLSAAQKWSQDIYQLL